MTKCQNVVYTNFNGSYLFTVCEISFEKKIKKKLSNHY